MPLLDLIRLQRAASAKSNNGGGSELDELLEADGCSRSADTMGDNGHLSTFKGDVESSIFSIPLDLGCLIAEVGYNLASEWVTASEHHRPDDSVADGKMRGYVLLALLEILDLIYFLKCLEGHSSGDQSLDILVE